MSSQSAQKGIPEGRVFELNSQRLDAVGTVTLQDMLDRRDWTGLPQYSAFALNKGSKTSSGIKAGTEAGAGGGGEGYSDGDAEAEMDVRKGMEAYYRRSGSGGGSDVVKGVERRSTSDSGDDSDDDMSYRSPGRNVRFEEEIDVRREIGDMNNGYSLFDLNEQEEEEVEQEVEEGVEGEVDEDFSDIQSSDISNFSNAVHEDQADGEETVIEEEDVYDSAAIEVGGEGEVEVEIEEEEDFSSLLSDVDKWLSEN